QHRGGAGVVQQRWVRRVVGEVGPIPRAGRAEKGRDGRGAGGAGSPGSGWVHLTSPQSRFLTARGSEGRRPAIPTHARGVARLNPSMRSLKCKIPEASRILWSAAARGGSAPQSATVSKIHLPRCPATP